MLIEKELNNATLTSNVEERHQLADLNDFDRAVWELTSQDGSARELQHTEQSAESREVDLKTTKQLVEHNAHLDSLTGIFNRRHLDEKLEFISLAKGHRRIAVLHIDLDRFKHINHTLGHEGGNTILRTVAKILTENSPQNTAVCRTGCDEFVMLIEDAPPDQLVQAMAEKIISRLNKPVKFPSHECHYSGSIGIAIAEADMIDGKKLLINADIALYRAKKNGRNQWCRFTAEMQKEIINQKRRTDEIKRGLERGEFIPYYQPQFSAATLEVSGVEALARWKHPTDGLLTPDKFLSIAEEINAVARIDEAILKQSLVDLAEWQAIGIEIPRLSVNVSARRIMDDDLPKALAALNIPKHTLSFELLESIYFDQQCDVMTKNLAELKKLGIEIEIDDFGTGHASIAAILSLRPNKFKIDRNLVMPIVRSAEQRKLVASIIDIGRSLNIAVVAEGVETMDHAFILQQLGCDYLQGYAFARPMTAADIVHFASSSRLQRAA